MGKKRVICLSTIRKRLLKNRQFAQDSRLRRKEKIEELERQVQELSAESIQLQARIASTRLSPHSVEVDEAKDSLLRKLESFVGKDVVLQAELREVMEEMKDKLGIEGTIRIKSLRNVFQQTIASLVPNPVLVSLVLHEAYQSSTLPLMQASLGPELFQVFSAHYPALLPQFSAVRETLDSFKASAVDIMQQISALHALVTQAIRGNMSPVQCARFILWLDKHCSQLEAEKVLNYGHNTSELLNTH